MARSNLQKWQYWKKVEWHLQICNGCFTQVSESWLIGLLFRKWALKIYLVGTHQNPLDEVLLLNICFHGDVREAPIHFGWKSSFFGANLLVNCWILPW